MWCPTPGDDTPTERITDLMEVSTDYVACLNPQHWYGANYLTDLVHAMTYSNAAITGKAGCPSVRSGTVTPGDADASYAYVESVRADAALFRTEVFRGKPLAEVVELLTHGGMTASLSRSGHRVFSADPFNCLLHGTTLGDELTATAEAFNV